MTLALGLLALVVGPRPPAWAKDEPAEAVPGGGKAAEESTRENGEADRKQAEKLNGQAVALYRTGKFEEAVALARRALDLREKGVGPDHPDVARSLNNLATMLRDLGAFAEAKALWERAISIEAKAFGADHPVVATRLNALGLMYMKKGEFSEARSHYERALAIAEAAHGPNHALVARTLEYLASALSRLERLADARPLYERALGILVDIHGADHRNVAVTRHNYALLLRKCGALRDARPHFERALGTFERIHGPNHVSVATVLDNLGALLGDLGAHEEAAQALGRALATFEEARGPNHPSVARVLDRQAGIHTTLGAYDEALAAYERALAIHERAYGPNHHLVATSLSNLASAHLERGSPDDAWPLVERAVTILETARGPDHPSLAIALDNLAVLHRSRGAYELARPLQERAIAILERVLGPRHPAVGDSLENLAILLEAQGAFVAALPIRERSLDIVTETYGRDHPRLARGLNGLGTLFMTLAEYAEARPLLVGALAIHERTYGTEHHLVALGNHLLACVLEQEGAYEEAQAYGERGLTLYEKLQGPTGPLVARSLNTLAMIREGKGEFAEAESLYLRALAILEETRGPLHGWTTISRWNLALLYAEWDQPGRAAPQLEHCLNAVEAEVRRGLAASGGPERLALVHSLRGYLDRWLEVCTRAGRSGYAEVLRFKGLAARAAAAERRLYRQGGSEADAHVRHLRVADRRLAQLAHAMPTFRERDRRAEWQKRYVEASAKRERVARSLARRFAPLRVGLERLDLGLEEVRAHLDPGDALVDYLLTGDRYLAFVVRPDDAVRRLDLGSAEAIHRAIRAFTTLTTDRHTSHQDPRWRSAGQALGRLVIEPILALLGANVRRVHLCPDAALATVPFAALPVGKTGRYLVDDYSLIRVSMAQDLVPWTTTAPKGKGALIVGDVDYGRAAAGSESSVAPPPPAVTALLRAPRGRTFAPLPETRGEAEYVRRRFGESGTVLRGAEATEGRVRSEAEGRHTLHLATHGFVRDDLLVGLRRRKTDRRWLGAAMETRRAFGHDPRLLAGLALAGANAHDGAHGDDGILTAAEASHLRLDGVELVVLSACDTALGRAAAGEGVIGLVQAFQMAGARQVVASLWPVDDTATRLLMEHFYERICRTENPLSPAEALRAAALKVRGTTGPNGRSYAHPRYWAAFVAYRR